MSFVVLGSSPTSSSPPTDSSSDWRRSADESFPGTCSPAGSRSERRSAARRAGSTTQSQPPGGRMIAAELEELLQPLERFESIRRRAVRLGDRLCDLSYA